MSVAVWTMRRGGPCTEAGARFRNDRCGNRGRFVPTKAVSKGFPLGTKGNGTVLLEPAPFWIVRRVIDLLTTSLSRGGVRGRGFGEAGFAAKVRFLRRMEI